MSTPLTAKEMGAMMTELRDNAQPVKFVITWCAYGRHKCTMLFNTRKEALKHVEILIADGRDYNVNW